ncbi:hypothetical protein N7470_008924 [Penicillium chermesinum]|nr:hypothetical protein N7470_008924 [Penicillium chermesinum]
MASTIVLITGANRGIGKGILELYLKKPNHTVIAATRDPSHSTSQGLAELPKAEGTSLVIVKIDALSPNDPAAAVKELASKGIGHIDILVANAGIALSWPKVIEVKVEDIQKHVDVNIYGFIYLYQAFRAVLKKAKAPKWVTIGSSSAFLTVSIHVNYPEQTSILTMSIVSSKHYTPYGCEMSGKLPTVEIGILTIFSNFLHMQNAAYAPTKGAQHWYTKAISVEDPWLNAFPVDPGWVQTDLGNRGADAFGFKEAAISVADSAAGVVGVIDASNLESHSGKLWKFDGNQEPW